MRIAWPPVIALRRPNLRGQHRERGASGGRAAQRRSTRSEGLSRAAARLLTIIISAEPMPSASATPISAVALTLPAQKSLYASTCAARMGLVSTAGDCAPLPIAR